jgi:hypothetical protein
LVFETHLAYFVILARCLTALLISPWHINFKSGVDSGKSTNRLSCNVFAKKIPKK